MRRNKGNNQEYARFIRGIKLMLNHLDKGGQFGKFMRFHLIFINSILIFPMMDLIKFTKKIIVEQNAY